jgi:hypothetical protein
MAPLALTLAMSVIFPASTVLIGMISNTTSPLDFHSPFHCWEIIAFPSPSPSLYSTRMTCSTSKSRTSQTCNRVPWYRLSMSPCITNALAAPFPTGTTWFRHSFALAHQD